MTCFYCGGSISSDGNLPQTKLTLDHIYPRWLLRQLTKPQRSKLTTDFIKLNTVECCSACNVYKGHIHPLDWLVIMPNPHNAKKLAERLVKMGENMQEVFDALKRRKLK